MSWLVPTIVLLLDAALALVAAQDVAATEASIAGSLAAAGVYFGAVVAATTLVHARTAPASQRMAWIMRAACIGTTVFWYFGTLDHGVLSELESTSTVFVASVMLSNWYAMKRAGPDWLFPGQRPGLTTYLRLIGLSCAAAIALLLATLFEQHLVRLAMYPTGTLATGLDKDWGGAPIAAVIAGALLFAPFVEELFFRFMLLRALMKYLPRAASILLSAIAFAASHTEHLSMRPAALASLMAIFIGGVALGTIYLHSRTLLAPIAVHMAYNALAFSPFPLPQVDPLLRTHVTAPVSVVLIVFGSLCFLWVSRATKPRFARSEPTSPSPSTTPPTPPHPPPPDTPARPPR